MILVGKNEKNSCIEMAICLDPRGIPWESPPWGWGGEEYSFPWGEDGGHFSPIKFCGEFSPPLGGERGSCGDPCSPQRMGMGGKIYPPSKISAGIPVPAIRGDRDEERLPEPTGPR
ncbi:hypothetical protein SLEP1_g57601 [Rubroshorea leprosula]|uniref:Uncharacterized protein n=1 Tax=Rubroshorea leprosula TaxID=152421 RepID=A0AAV5MNE4_9ROSI|nr:hypothetical protein SLEP1_g57601 [Rubroshorea leprosula]